MTRQSLSLSGWTSLSLCDKFHLDKKKRKKRKKYRATGLFWPQLTRKKKKKRKKERKKERSRFYPPYLGIVQPHNWLPFSTRRAPAGRAPTQKVPPHHGGSAQDRQIHTLQSTLCTHSTLSQTPLHVSNDSNPNETLGLNLLRHM